MRRCAGCRATPCAHVQGPPEPEMDQTMPDIHLGRFGILSVVGQYKPGDPPPTGYNDWHEWAEVQHKAGLRQKLCGRCSLWCYPQELSDLEDVSYARTGRGAKRGGGREVKVVSPVCKKCAAEKPS